VSELVITSKTYTSSFIPVLFFPLFTKIAVMIDGRIRMDLNWTVQFYLSTTKIPLCVNLPEDGCLKLKHERVHL
jgi:hypothetical protein